jgi:hypothetical protein
MTPRTNNVLLRTHSPVILPDQRGPHPHELVISGKNGTINLIDRDNMGHQGAGSDDQIVQNLPGIFPNGTEAEGNFTAPVYFNGTLYFGAVNDTIQAFRLTEGLLPLTPSSRSAATFAFPGASLAISADGAARGILWAIERRAIAVDDQDSTTGGVLRAYDADNLALELYNSDQAGTRDALSPAAKYTVPLVANGKVFVLTVDGLSA